jgi:2-polyprenyl-3-methyl-5-hydroxy-6-metoxy-1,4-benzoquinol methylase
MKYPLSYQLYETISIISFILSKVSRYIRKLLFRAPSFALDGYDYYSDFLNAINDCCEFLQIDLKTFIKDYNEHQDWTGKLWEQSKGDSKYYYDNIPLKYGDKNLIANCIFSFSLKYSYDALYYYLKQLADIRKTLTVCDFGCANAHLSFAMMQRGLISQLYMYDLPNKSADFVNHRNRKYGITTAEWHDARNIEIKANQFDAIICFDVLEHLPNPTEMLSKILYPILKKGGYLFLQAPWNRGVPSHLDEAIFDFYLKGGKKFLSNKFRKIYTMTAMDISGVWMKK